MNTHTTKTWIRTKAWGALRMPGVLMLGVAAAVLAACSTMAEPNAALDRAHAGYRTLQADPQVSKLAPAEMSQAEEALRTADLSWQRHDKASVVDHLAYLAQQRVGVAREVASTKFWEQAIVTAKAGLEKERSRAENQKAQNETAVARQNTRDKSVELAAAKADVQTARADAQVDKARATDLEMQLKDLNAKQTERGAVFTVSDVQFDTNRAEVRGHGGLDKLVAFFKLHPTRTALIEGFTDSKGAASANLDLSQRRAVAVRDAMIDLGVGSERLSTRGYGESYPVATNTTNEGRQTNRRVEILISDEGGQLMPR
jgi:outer membrane protein OmpA-like peptidoglycan-associated protein